MTAVYSGDANLASSTSPVMVQDVHYPCTITMAPNLTEFPYGTTISMEAQLSSPYGTPLYGGVEFRLNSSTLLSGGLLTYQGSYSLSVGYTSAIPVGTGQLTATYTGYANFGACTSAPVTVTVSKAA